MPFHHPTATLFAATLIVALKQAVVVVGAAALVIGAGVLAWCAAQKGSTDGEA